MKGGQQVCGKERRDRCHLVPLKTHALSIHHKALPFRSFTTSNIAILGIKPLIFGTLWYIQCSNFYGKLNEENL